MKNNRRIFLKQSFLTTIILFSHKDIIASTTILDDFKVLHLDLFPLAKELGINSVFYMNLVFHHSKISQKDKRFLKNGIKWLNEESIKHYGKKYTKLSPKNRQNILKIISKTEWGDSFLYDCLSYLFEAMVGDPIYGGNSNSAGWRWLNFEAGKPRAKEVYL